MKCLVIDEADDLLASNFRRDMARIVDHTGSVLGGRQTVIVSATLKRETLDQYSYMAPNLVHVKATKKERRRQKRRREARRARLGRRRVAPAQPRALLRGWRRAGTRWTGSVARSTPRARSARSSSPNFGHRLTDTRDKLAARGMPCSVLHGGMNKLERANELAAFRRGIFALCSSRTSTARGIDVPEVDAVFNLDLPTDETHYVHRAGRTGRMGADGMVMTLAAPDEAFVLTKIQRKLGIDIKAADLQKGRVVPDRGNKPTPRKEHAEAKKERAEREKEKEKEKVGAGAGKGGSRPTRGERAAERRGTFEDEFQATRGFGAKPKAYTPKGQPRRRNRD